MFGAAAAAVILIALSLALARRARARTLARLRAEWGHPVARERDLNVIGDRGTPADALDDRTWSDLLLDDVFAVVDRAVSAVGQQALLFRLRQAPTAPNREAFEALVNRFEIDATGREAAQMALVGLSNPAACYLHRLCVPGAIDRRGWHAIFPAIGLAMLIALLLTFAWPPALLVVIVGVGVNFAIRMATARRVGVNLASFRQLGPLFAAAAALARLDAPATAPLTGRLDADLAALKRLRVVSRWVSRDPAQAGELLASVLEYLNLLFLLDLNALYFAAGDIERHAAALLRVIDDVGAIDAAIAVASWRTELGTGGWTRPQFGDPDAAVELEALRHPLVPGAVPNSVSLAPPHGILVTGSNMSGKSTFLRTVGVNVVLAQTLNTCLASRYRAPLYRVRSCIAVNDDLLAGKSYYLVEVEAVLAMVAAAAAHDPFMFLFDELFRGTNAAERIAAAESMLHTLVDGGRPHVVLAATHDGELVELLRHEYQVCHFGDHLGTDGLTFDYQLLMGPATSRNAIALLRLGGAPASLVERATSLAADLDRAQSSLARHHPQPSVGLTTETDG